MQTQRFNKYKILDDKFNIPEIHAYHFHCLPWKLILTLHVLFWVQTPNQNIWLGLHIKSCKFKRNTLYLLIIYN